MLQLRSLLRCALPALLVSSAAAQLQINFTFNPSSTGSTCGLGGVGDLWVYGCFDTEIDHYSATGTYLGSIPRPGGSTNDVDIEYLEVPITLNGTTVPAGSLLLFDGESGPCEVYAVDTATGAVIATLMTPYGDSHVVGGAYHSPTGTLFLVQDRNGGAAANEVAEIDPDTGAVLSTFSTLASGVDVNYGDIDSSAVSDNLYIVSSNESTVAEFTIGGQLVAQYDLPAGVSGLSGIASDDLLGGAWVCSSSGTVWFLSGLVQIGTPYCAPANPNSSGAPSIIRAFGSQMRDLNNVRLVVFQLPTNSFGYFLTSRTQGFAANPAGSQGDICLGGSIGRYNFPAQIYNSTGVGRGELDLDLFQTPTPNQGLVVIQPGETWHFQGWYRDANPNPTSNFSDGVSVMFL